MNTSFNRQHAHELIERLEAPSLVTAVHFLEFLMLDPVSRSPATAPFEDEPLTEEEARALRDSEKWFQHNPGIPHEEILAEFGLSLDDSRNTDGTAS